MRCLQCRWTGLQVRLGTLSDTAGVTVVGLAGAGVHDGADDDQGLLDAEGVNVRGLNVGKLPAACRTLQCPGSREWRSHQKAGR